MDVLAHEDSIDGHHDTHHSLPLDEKGRLGIDLTEEYIDQSNNVALQYLHFSIP